ncbi:MAG: hypothetical protein HZB39_00030 [Planctomycetes bacterium]|nr:hypothetical protein [Planctomycetota bacterium]
MKQRRPRGAGRDTADGWLPHVAECLASYVYLLRDPREVRPFYIGKGVGGRCFAHLVEARRTRQDSSRDFKKLDTIRAIEGRGDRVVIEILRHGLNELTALAIESAAIDLLGLKDLVNIVSGHHSGRAHVEDLNARYGAKPAQISKHHPVVLIRIARHYHALIEEQALYDVTRSWWRIAKRRCNPETPGSPRWAFAVFDGVVRAVFEIDGWEEPDPKDFAHDPGREGRRAFVGRRSMVMEKRYRLTDVTRWLPKGSQSPLRFVNCE